MSGDRNTYTTGVNRLRTPSPSLRYGVNRFMKKRGTASHDVKLEGPPSPPQAFIDPKGTIPTFHSSNIPSFLLIVSAANLCIKSSLSSSSPLHSFSPFVFLSFFPSIVDILFSPSLAISLFFLNSPIGSFKRSTHFLSLSCLYIANAFS